jgi:hypothetical protein
VSGKSNPAILLKADENGTLAKDEESLTKLFDTYSIINARWDFCSVWVLEQLYVAQKFRSKTELRRIYQALRGNVYSATGGLIGRMLEVLTPENIIQHGIHCERVKGMTNATVEFQITKITEQEMVSTSKSVEEIIHECVDTSKIYVLTKNYPGFDMFIPPNNFIGITQTSRTGKGSHPILLSVALDCSNAIRSKDEDMKVNFITAVPLGQKEKWMHQQSFLVNVPEVVKQINVEGDPSFALNGQRKLKKLPDSIQLQLENFQQYVGCIKDDSLTLDDTVANKFVAEVNLPD